MCYFNLTRYRRYFGVIVTHYTASLHTARRTEMVEVLGTVLMYLNPYEPVPVDSTYSDLPLQVVLICSNDLVNGFITTLLGYT